MSPFSIQHVYETEPEPQTPEPEEPEWYVHEAEPDEPQEPEEPEWCVHEPEPEEPEPRPKRPNLSSIERDTALARMPRMRGTVALSERARYLRETVLVSFPPYYFGKWLKLLNSEALDDWPFDWGCKNKHAQHERTHAGLLFIYSIYMHIYIYIYIYIASHIYIYIYK
jgi:hypothetical protein